MEYQKIYKQTFGEEISYEEARAQGMRLLRLMKLIYAPVPQTGAKTQYGNKAIAG